MPPSPVFYSRLSLFLASTSFYFYLSILFSFLFLVFFFSLSSTFPSSFLIPYSTPLLPFYLLLFPIFFFSLSSFSFPNIHPFLLFLIHCSYFRIPILLLLFLFSLLLFFSLFSFFLLLFLLLYHLPFPSLPSLINLSYPLPVSYLSLYLSFPPLHTLPLLILSLLPFLLPLPSLTFVHLSPPSSPSFVPSYLWTLNHVFFFFSFVRSFLIHVCDFVLMLSLI